MKSDMHKMMYKEMLGHLIKKMRKGMVGGSEKKDHTPMSMSESDVMEEGEMEDEMESDFSSPEELAEYMKPKKKKESREGIAIFAAMGKASQKPKGMPFKKSGKY